LRFNARLDFSILIFPNLRRTLRWRRTCRTVRCQHSRRCRRERRADNPDVRAALAAVQASNHDVFGARARGSACTELDYFYGMRCDEVCARTQFSRDRNSRTWASSVWGTLIIPIWNWGSTQSKVKQAELRRDQTKRELSLAQRGCWRRFVAVRGGGNGH